MHTLYAVFNTIHWGSESQMQEKKIATLHKQQAALSTFDEKLRHHADQRISLDLDDGVKINYGKFGDLLADVKAITGDKAEWCLYNFKLW